MAYQEFYAQTTGSNLNAGSTTSDAAEFTYTNAVSASSWNAATGVFTVASGNPQTDGVSVGMWASVYVTAGATVAVFIGRITNVSTTAITVSLTVKSGTPPSTDGTGATTIKVGGAWKGPNASSLFPWGFIQNTQTESVAAPPRVNFLSGTNYAVSFTTGTTGVTHSNAGPAVFAGYKAWLTGVTAEADDDTFTKNSHGMSTGDIVEMISGTGFTGITAGREYYAIVLTANTFKLAQTAFLAAEGTAIAISADGTSGVFRVADEAVITGSDADLPYNMIAVSGARNSFIDLKFALNGQDVSTNTNGNILFQLTGADTLMKRVRFEESWRDALRATGAGSIYIECEALFCNVDGANQFAPFHITEESTFIRCWVHHNTKPGDEGDCHGYQINSATGETIVFINCIASHNGACGFIGISNAPFVQLLGCISAYNGTDGVRFTSTSGGVNASFVLISNCALIDNAVFGIRSGNTNWGPYVTNCGFFSNGSGEISNGNESYVSGVLSLSGDPFTDGANGDFRLNSTTGSGAALRNAGIGTFLVDTSVYTSGANTISYPDVGGVQHEDSSAPAAGQTSYTFG